MSLRVARTAAIAIVMMVSLARAEDYSIKLDRPHKVDDQFKVDATGTEKQRLTVTVNGQVVQNKNDDYKVELIGRCKVIEVGADGQIKKLACTVDKCKKTTGADTTDIIEPGKTFTAVHGDKQVEFSMEGAEIPPDAQEALRVVIDVHRMAEPSDDEVFGTMEKRKPGDSWPINTELAAKSASDSGLTVKKESITGNTQLVETVTDHDVPCLRVKAEMNVSDVAPPGMPPGFKVDSCSIKAKVTGLFPVDLNKQRVSESQEMSMSLSGGLTAPDGGKMTMQMDATKTMEARISEYKSAN